MIKIKTSIKSILDMGHVRDKTGHCPGHYYWDGQGHTYINMCPVSVPVMCPSMTGAK